MKFLGPTATILILSFWVTMNALLIQRDLEFQRQGEFKSGIDKLLGESTTRESWMSIYQNHRKVGYSGHTIEKIYAEEGIEYQVAIDLLYRGRFPLPNLLAEFLKDSNQLRIAGRLFLDEELEPTQLGLNANLTLLRGTAVEQSVDIIVQGKRIEDAFRVDLFTGDPEVDKPTFSLRLPVDKMTLSNGLSPSLPIADYEIGRKYRLAVFDPISSFGFGSDDATIEVISREEKRIDGMLVDLYVLETVYRDQTTRSWVTANGDVLRQEIGKPFHVILRKETSRRNALRGFIEDGDFVEGGDATAEDKETAR